MTADRAGPMRRSRRLDSERKRTLVLAATDALLQRGGYPNIAAIARAAGVGRKFIYDHPDLRAEIELKVARATQGQANDVISSARVSGASLRADLANSRAQNHRLTGQLRSLEKRLSHAEGARLVADDLLPEGMLAELADRQLAQHITDLEQRLFDAEEELRRTVEELEAARAICRELMQQANQPISGQPHRSSPAADTPTDRRGGLRDEQRR